MALMNPTELVLVLGVLFALIRFRWSQRVGPGEDLPPSPPRDFLIGHLRKVPRGYQWKTFAEWGKTLGSVIHLNVLGNEIIVLNSVDDARELLDKRGPSYSNRPRAVFVSDMLGWKYAMILLPYGDRLRAQRRMVQQVFNSNAIKDLEPMQKEQTNLFLRSLLDDDNCFFEAIKRYNLATVMKATCGRDVSDSDELVTLIDQTASLITPEDAPGSALIDLLPALRYLPKFFFGAKFRDVVKRGRKLRENILEIPYRDVEMQKVRGSRGQSLLERLVDDYEAQGHQNEEHEQNIKNVISQILTASIDTMSTAFEVFLLMMVIHPQVVTTAQREIDDAVGRDRLPDLRDRKSLPFVDCILKEVLRFNPPSPLGLPHASTADDTYKGMRIPSGATVVANIWQMMQDEKYFQDSNSFRPERFLKRVMGCRDPTDALNELAKDDPSAVVFGFGRRVCPGRYFADANMWLGFVRLLAVFDFHAYVNPTTGREELPKVGFTSGLVTHVKPFKYRICARSEHHACLIKSLATSQ